MHLLNRLFNGLYASLWLTAIIICYTCCGSPQQNNPVKEFEGVITYRVEYHNDPIGSMAGDTVHVFYANGNIAKIYNCKTIGGVSKTIFLAEKCINYNTRLGNDSVYTYDLSKNNLQQVSVKHEYPETGILGHECESIVMQHHFDGKATCDIYDSYYYSPGYLPVNKAHFRNWTFAGFNDYINAAGCFYLKYETDMKFIGQDEPIRKIYYAVNVKEQKVDSRVFEIDTSKVVMKTLE